MNPYTKPQKMVSPFGACIVLVNRKKNTRGIFGAMEKRQKSIVVKELAEKYFQEGKITERVYNALMRYEVEITD